MYGTVVSSLLHRPNQISEFYINNQTIYSLVMSPSLVGRTQLVLFVLLGADMIRKLLTQCC